MRYSNEISGSKKIRIWDIRISDFRGTLEMSDDANAMKLCLVFLISFLVLCAYLIQMASARDDLSSVDLWINKTANKSVFNLYDDIIFTINYGNRGKTKAENVIITDIMPPLEISYMSSTPNSIIDNNFTWVIGTVEPGENGSIVLMVEPPKTLNMDFKEDSSVSGNGYVRVRKKISTIEQNNTITNEATISASSNGIYSLSSSSVTIKLANKPNAGFMSHEHGSGYYQEVSRSSLNNTIHDMKLKKELSSQHKTVDLSLPRNRTVKLGSLWSDSNSVWTDDLNLANSVTDESRYMDSINESISYSVYGNNIISSAAGNFSGGIYHIEFRNRELESKNDAAYISESYHGSFETTHQLDAYRSSPTYKRESSGFGFISSQIVLGCDRRTGEYGSGDYASSVSIQADSTEKNMTGKYSPVDVQVADAAIRYKAMWHESMYTRDAEKGSEILNEISSADFIQKDALMSTTYLSMTARFNGTNYLKARSFADIKNSSREAFRVEQTLTGSYQMETTVGLAQSLRYSYPHLNLTKRILKEDGNIFTYRIWVNNDGNATLMPVVVVDLMPVGGSFISSTLKPSSLKDRVVSWTLQAVPSGETQVIDIKLSIDSVSPAVINWVQGVGKYQNRTVVSDATASIYDTMSAEETTSENVTTEPVGSTGDWMPPSCFSLNSSMTTCECDFDEYYNNLTDDCSDAA